MMIKMSQSVHKKLDIYNNKKYNGLIFHVKGFASINFQTVWMQLKDSL